MLPACPEYRRFTLCLQSLKATPFRPLADANKSGKQTYFLPAQVPEEQYNCPIWGADHTLRSLWHSLSGFETPNIYKRFTVLLSCK